MTQRGRVCYFWIQSGEKGKLEVRRCEDKIVQIVISLFMYNLEVDVRDKRTLVCFDGSIPSGGLPKGSTIVRVEDNPKLSCDLARVYKKRDKNEEDPLYSVENKKAIQRTKRYFVLLLSGRAVFRMFKTDTLQPKYLIVDVKDGVAEFSTTSY